MIARAAALHGARDLRIERVETPPLPPGMVRVRFAAGGICGSDLHYFGHGRTGSFVVTEPLVLGHEIAGEVAEVSDGVEGLKHGTRVAVNPARFCGHCSACAGGRPNLCENLFFMGSASRTPHMQGGFRDLIDVAPSQCVPVPDSLPIGHAALAEPLAVCLHAAARAGDLKGRRVAITGAGPIGLLLLLVARDQGAAATVVTDLAKGALDHAERLGASAVLDASDPDALASQAPDVVFEASGAPSALAAAIRVVRRGGTVVQVGNLPAGDLPAPLNLVMAKEVDLRGSLRFGHEFAEAVALIVQGRIDVGALVTSELPLDEAPAAFALAADRSRSVKVLLRP